MTRTEEAAQAIADYLRAYEGRHGLPTKCGIEYHNGWIVFIYGWGEMRCRLAEFKGLTERLNDRAKATGGAS